MSHEIRRGPETDAPGLERVTLSSPAGLEAAFVPSVGMVGVSLTLDGVELLAPRHGLEAYLEHGSTFGLPLLAPWANRLASRHQQVGETSWELAPDASGVHPDEYGQPIHGLVPGAWGWVVEDVGADAASAHLLARWRFDADNPRFASFPFPFELEVETSLRADTLRVRTRLVATSRLDVPVAFGWHPWFEFPDVPRDEWDVRAPLGHRAVLSATKIPTGEVVDDPVPEGRLRDTVLDDVYVAVAEGTEVSVRAGSRRVVVRYLTGYPVAVVFAPSEHDVICVEPMTAPTDPFSGRFPLRFASEGAPYEAVFEIAVQRC
jgi:aldose 1-epimerase